MKITVIKDIMNKTIFLGILVAFMLLTLPQVNAFDCLLDTNNDGDADTNTDTDSDAFSNGSLARVACGNKAKASGPNSIAIGDDAQATNTDSVAMGRASRATGVNSTALGRSANATMIGSTAVGRTAIASGENSTAIGADVSGDSKGAQASELDTTAIGVEAKATQQGATALGKGAIASSFFSIAFGLDSLSTGSNSTAVGQVSKAQNTGTSAFGSGANAENEWTTAIGYLTSAEGWKSTAVGTRAESEGEKSTAIGEMAFTDSISVNAIALGQGASVTNARNGIAIGGDLDGDTFGAKATMPGAIAIGADVVADKANTMKVGVPIEVVRKGDAKVFVEDTSPTTIARTLFEISNNGNTKFTVTNSDANEQWSFANPGTGFRLSRQNSGSVEFEVKNNGNAVLAGTLTENSDVHSKQDIQILNQKAILEKVMQLPISEWRYKDDPNSKHIGPMAQDFYQAFELGNTDKGISTLDSSGVALAAIQALKTENEVLKDVINELLLRVLSLEAKD